MKLPSKIAVIGLGLIGGSMALALKKKTRVIAYDLNTQTCKEAAKAGIPTADLAGAVSSANMVILSTPVRSIPQVGLEIAPYLRPGTVVTDVGSCKVEVVHKLEDHLPRNCLYIGGHPMAGSEKSGFSYARADLFQGAPYVITPTGSTHPKAVEIMLYIVETLGAKPLFLESETHDRLMAIVSHLPYLVAVTLARTVREVSQIYPEIPSVAAGGFRDMTRLASSDIIMASDFCTSNKDSLGEALNIFLQHLTEVTKSLRNGDVKTLLAEAKHFRDSLAAERGW